MYKIVLIILFSLLPLSKINSQPSFGKIESLVKIILDYPLMKTNFTTQQLDAWDYKVTGYSKEIEAEMSKLDPNILPLEELSESDKKVADELSKESNLLRDELVNLYVKAFDEAGITNTIIPTNAQEAKEKIMKGYNVLNRYVAPQTGEIAKYHAKLRSFMYGKWIPFAKSLQGKYKYAPLGGIALADISGVYINYALIMGYYISYRDGYESLK